MAFLINAWHSAGWTNELEDNGLLACDRNADSPESDAGIQDDAENIFQFQDGAMVSDYPKPPGVAELIPAKQAESTA
ncbi:MAG: hypothetical protein AB8B54_11635 [Sphingorhabdus sp.]